MIVPVACGLQPNLASSKIGLEPAFSRSLPRLCNESNRVLWDVRVIVLLEYFERDAEEFLESVELF